MSIGSLVRRLLGGKLAAISQYGHDSNRFLPSVEGLMHLWGPFTYSLCFSSEELTCVYSKKGSTKFSAPVTRGKSAKIYVVSDGNEPVYVGATISPIQSRLSRGFKHNPEKKRYAYKWRHLGQATISIWMLCLEDKSVQKEHMETIEGEVVYLFRTMSCQWPKYQNEIHFHESQNDHRIWPAGLLAII